MKTKQIILLVSIVLVAGVGFYFFYKHLQDKSDAELKNLMDEINPNIPLPGTTGSDESTPPKTEASVKAENIQSVAANIKSKISW